MKMPFSYLSNVCKPMFLRYPIRLRISAWNPHRKLIHKHRLSPLNRIAPTQKHHNAQRGQNWPSWTNMG